MVEGLFSPCEGVRGGSDFKEKMGFPFPPRNRFSYPLRRRQHHHLSDDVDYCQCLVADVEISAIL